MNYIMTKPEGLFYFPKIIDDQTCQTIIQSLDQNIWTPLTITVDTGRKVQQFGYYFDYFKHDVIEKAPNIPLYLNSIMETLTQKCNENKLQYGEFNQCIVNNYYKGEGISPHTDILRFGPVIGCFTLNSGAEMQFTNTSGETYKLYTEPGSLYIMSGPARETWKHEMKHRDYDVVEGNEIQRNRRISITFRYVSPIRSIVI